MGRWRRARGWFTLVGMVAIGLAPGCGPGGGDEVGKVAAPLPGSFCSHTPEHWRAWCRAHPGVQPTLCAQLAAAVGGEAEIAALALNVEASDDGEAPGGLGELRFRSGARTRFTLREWVERARSTGASDALHDEAARVAADANRSFRDCASDIGDIAGEVTLPVCYASDQSAVGPQGATCASLDSECGRGVFDAAAGCCDVKPRPAGVPCPGGVCDGAGACGHGRLRPGRPGVTGVRGEASWVDIVGGGQVSLWYPAHAVEVRVDEQPVLRLPTSPGRPMDLSDVHLVLAPPESAFAAVGVIAPVHERTVVLARRADTDQVCVAPGNFDELGTLLPDCSSQGTLTLDCPGSNGNYSCEVDGDQFTVHGPDIGLVWERFPRADQDVHTLMLPFCLDIGGGRCARLGCDPPCAPGSVRLCGVGSNHPSLQHCTPFGCLTPCPVPPERCDGRDDDGDGRIDEGGANLCDDDISCTLDGCIRGRCQHFALDGLCQSGTKACEESTCLRQPPLGSSGAPSDTIVHDRANGCFRRLRDQFCQDGCDCNGAETCDPDHSTEDSGCVSPLPFDPVAHRRHWPCESDNDNCTIEPCCEANPDQCRVFQELPPADQQRVRALCDDWTDVPAFARGPFEHHSETGNNVFCPSGLLPISSARVDCTSPSPGGPDGNPCTRQSCDPNTGLCSVLTPLNGDQTGCTGPVNEGCAVQSCNDGACVLSENPDKTDPETFTCHDQLLVPTPNGFVVPTCKEKFCNGVECDLQSMSPDPCSDGLACDGLETCKVPFDPSLSANGIVGCQAGTPLCTFHPSCVSAVCSEVATNGSHCTFTPRDDRCRITPQGRSASGARHAIRLGRPIRRAASPPQASATTAISAQRTSVSRGIQRLHLHASDRPAVPRGAVSRCEHGHAWPRSIRWPGISGLFPRCSR